MISAFWGRGRVQALQPPANFRQSRSGHDFSGAHQLGAVFEGVVLVAIHIRFDHQVGGLFPLAAVHLLGDGKTLPNHIEQVPRPVGRSSIFP